MFDLKGSLLGRYTKVTTKKLRDGTGLEVLKDKNLIMLNKSKNDNLKQSIPHETLNQLSLDSAFLRSHNLIDYSVFLVQVDKNFPSGKECKPSPSDSKNSKSYTIVPGKDNSTFFKIAIIDFLTVYNLAKDVESRLKSKISNVDPREISATDATTYQERFIQFIQNNL